MASIFPRLQPYTSKSVAEKSPRQLQLPSWARRSNRNGRDFNSISSPSSSCHCADDVLRSWIRPVDTPVTKHVLARWAYGYLTFWQLLKWIRLINLVIVDFAALFALSFVIFSHSKFYFIFVCNKMCMLHILAFLFWVYIFIRTIQVQDHITIVYSIFIWCEKKPLSWYTFSYIRLYNYMLVIQFPIWPKNAGYPKCHRLW